MARQRQYAGTRGSGRLRQALGRVTRVTRGRRGKFTQASSSRERKPYDRMRQTRDPTMNACIMITTYPHSMLVYFAILTGLILDVSGRDRFNRRGGGGPIILHVHKCCIILLLIHATSPKFSNFKVFNENGGVPNDSLPHCN